MVYRSTNPIDAGFACDYLIQHGINARLLGTDNGALIGAGQHIFEQKVEVPSNEADAAAQTLASVDAPDEGVDTDESWDESDVESSVLLRSAVLAAGAPFALPGGGHIYACRWASGLFIAFAEVCALVVLVAVDGRPALGGAFVLCAMILYDVAGAQVAVRAFNRGERSSIASQVAKVAIAVALAAGAGALLAWTADRAQWGSRFSMGYDRAATPTVIIKIAAANAMDAAMTFS